MTSQWIPETDNHCSIFFCRREPRVKPTGEFLFGLHPVLLALQHEKRTVHKLHVLNRMRNAQDRKCGSPALQEIVRIAEHKDIPIEWCSKPELSYMSFQRQHQAIDYHSIYDIIGHTARSLTVYRSIRRRVCPTNPAGCKHPLPHEQNDTQV